MRVFVAVQPTPKGRVSSLSRYIAESKIDREREDLKERGSRPLFSTRQDDLTFKEADHILNPTSRELEKEDVIHVVVSPEPGSLDRAGDDDDERRKTFREAIRDTVREMERELNVRSLAWIAGLHDNTATPHAHMAVSRWATDAQTGKLVYIKHLPESLLPRNKEGPDGTKRFSTGKIAEVFARSLSHKLMPIRFVRLEDQRRGVEISRSVVSSHALMLREPTPEERIVGRWLEVQLMLAGGLRGDKSREEELLRESVSLVDQVVKIDTRARAQGARPPAAYIAPEKLGDLIRAKTNEIKISVASERPLTNDEKYVERVPDQPATSGMELPLATAGNNTEHNNEKALTSLHQKAGLQLQSKESNVKLVAKAPSNRARDEVTKGDRSTTRITPSRITTAEPASRIEEAPRIAKLTLFELRHVILQRNSSGSLNADGARETMERSIRTAPDVARPGTPKVRNAESQPTNNNAAPALNVGSGAPASIRSEPVRIGGEVSVGQQGVTTRLDAAVVSDKELTWLAGIAHFNRAFMDRDVSQSSSGRRIEESSSHRRYNADEVPASNFPKFNVRLHEATVLDEIYQGACKQRKLSADINAVQNYLRESLRTGSSTIVVLLDEMRDVREYLEAIAPLTSQSSLDEYQQLHLRNPWLNPDEHRYEHTMMKDHSSSKETELDETRERGQGRDGLELQGAGEELEQALEAVELVL